MQPELIVVAFRVQALYIAYVSNLFNLAVSV